MNNLYKSRVARVGAGVASGLGRHRRSKSILPRLFFLLLVLVLVLSLGPAGTTVQAQQNTRYFPQSGYSVDNDLIWSYFQARGGVTTFGYPVSDIFMFMGLPTQVFQRHILHVVGGQARPMNLLDPPLMPIRHLNGSTFPAYDSALAAAAPGPATPNYGQVVQQHLFANVPNVWQGTRVNFLDYYYRAAPLAPAGLETPIALETWGFPTSLPMRDPSNLNFVYQRFQRGLTHFDATTGATGGILLGDAFKSVLTGEHLPFDLASDMAGSPFLRLYAPGQPNCMAREAPSISLIRSNTNLCPAFQGQEPPTFTEVKVYLIALEDQGRSGPYVGCGDSAIPVTRVIPATQAPLRAAIEELLSLKTRDYGQSGLYNALYRSDLYIEHLSLQNGVATIRLAGEYQIGGTCDEPRVQAQLKYTALQFSTVNQVEIYINGQRIA